MYVRKFVGGRRSGVKFAELKVKEFVFGYQTTLNMSKYTMDRGKMLRMLLKIMQDATEFSWANVRAFYKLIGQDVEMGLIKMVRRKIEPFRISI